MPSVLRRWERITSGATHSFGRPTTRATHNTKRDGETQSLTAMTVMAPSRRERTETAALVKSYTKTVTTGGLTIRWGNLTQDEARQLIDLTRSRDRSTRAWWPVVLRGAGIKRRSS
jgi:hypothetical protein